MTVEIRLPGTAFEPGESVEVEVVWEVEETPKELVCDLLWFTSGKGDGDTEVILREQVAHPPRRGSHVFGFVLPDAPYSFSGKLISLTWAFEARVEYQIELHREDVIIAPGGQEVLL